MSVWDVLAQGARVAGAGFEGYAQDQATKAKDIIAQRKAADESERNRVLNLLTQREIAKPQLGDTNYADLEAGVARKTADAVAPIHTREAIATAAGVSPIHTQEAIDTERGTAPIKFAAEAHLKGVPTWSDLNPEPQIISANSPDGQPHVFRVPKRGGSATEVDNIVPKVGGTGGTMSGQTLMAMQRLGFTKNDLNQSIQQMEDFENNPANLAKLTAYMQTLGAGAGTHPSSDAHGILGALNNMGGAAISAAAQQKIAKDFPELAQYFYNKQRVGTAFTEVLPRPNQQLLGIEKGLSGIDVGWTPAVIKDVQARRRGGQEMLNNLLANTPVGQAINRAANPTAIPTKTGVPTYEEWKKSKGHE